MAGAATLPGGPNTAIYGIVAADFNGDGKSDLAVSITARNTGCGTAGAIPCFGTAILFGNGDGTFQDYLDASGNPVRTVPLTGNIAVGDFNGDGKPDLVGADAYSGSSFSSTTGHVSIALNRGDGTFSAPVDVGVIATASQVFAVDMNGDCKLDLVVPAFTSSGGAAIYVLLGKGDGTFGAAVSYPLPSPAAVASVGDLDGDGKPDVLVSYFVSASRTAALYLNNGDGTLRLASNAPGAIQNFLGADVFGGWVIGDLNGDHIPDLVAVGSQAADIYFGQGNLTFSAPTRIAAPVPPSTVYQTGVAIADWDLDGAPDIVMSSSGFQPLFFKNTGNGAFAAGQAVGSSVGGALLVNNLTGDALPDAVTWYNDRLGSSAAVVINATQGDFTLSSSGTTSATLRPGQSATLNLNLAPAGTFSGAVNLSCSGLPQFASCSFNPPSVPALSAATTVAVTIRTAGPFARNLAPRLPFSDPWQWSALALCLGMLGVSPSKPRRKGLRIALLALVAALGLTLLSCGGSSPRQTAAVNSSTPAGTSSVVIAAASGQVTHSVTVTLTVTN